MARNKSIERIAKTAQARDAKTRVKAAKQSATTVDSFVNFAHNLGVGADNALTSSTYGFNPITRNRTLLEWIHRGSWIGGIAVDVVADDMTRAGVEIKGEMEPEDIDAINAAAKRYNIWQGINDTVKWARLYGGAIAVLLVDGQNTETPLRMETIGNGQFKGLLVLDRWMVEPSLHDLVTDFGPSLGLPKYYTVTAQAPAMSGRRIHHSRCIRLEGVRLPYWQRLVENLWGISVLERLYDRMVAFDSATTGAAQLVFKSFIRTYKVKDLRKVVAAGGSALKGLTSYVDMMRRFQGIEGITLLDGDDEYTGDAHSAFSGLSDSLAQFGQQLSGALQIPLVRLFGQSPTGFSTGDTDLKNYYDGIKSRQESELGEDIVKVFRCLAAGEGIEWPRGTQVAFRSLWQLSDKEKAEIAEQVTRTVQAAEEATLVDRATALRELRQSSEVTGVWSNITKEMISDAEAEGPPIPEGAGEEAGAGKPGISTEGEQGKPVAAEEKVK